jgi:hypothetical protein
MDARLAALLIIHRNRRAIFARARGEAKDFSTPGKYETLQILFAEWMRAQLARRAARCKQTREERRRNLASIPSPIDRISLEP